jgi:hypothetical protein
VTEAERPLHERLSIFDRPQVEGDVPPDPEPSVRRWVEAADDPSAIRLGLEHAQTRIYLVLRNDNQISVLVRRWQCVNRPTLGIRCVRCNSLDETGLTRVARARRGA